MTTRNLPIKAIGRYRALYQVDGRVQRYVKVFGRLLGQLDGEKLHPDLNALLVCREGGGYIFATTEAETCAEALARYIEQEGIL